MSIVPDFRPHLSGDRPAVVRLRHDGHAPARPAHAAAERTLERFDSCLGLPEADGLVAEADGRLVELAAIGGGEIEQLHFATGARRSGVRQAPLWTPDGRRETHPTHIFVKQLSSLD